MFALVDESVLALKCTFNTGDRVKLISAVQSLILHPHPSAITATGI